MDPSLQLMLKHRTSRPTISFNPSASTSSVDVAVDVAVEDTVLTLLTVLLADDVAVLLRVVLGVRNMQPSSRILARLSPHLKHASRKRGITQAATRRSRAFS